MSVLKSEPTSRHETTSVIICGGGPTGILLSTLLGQFQIPNVVLEKEADIVTDPRGVGLDEDGIRLLQNAGVYDRVFTEVGSCSEKFAFISGVTSDLHKRPLMTLDYSTSEGGTGHVGFMCHRQPMLEKVLRDRIDQLEHSEIRTEAALVAIEEDDKQVTATYQDREGNKKMLSASFLVGADGKTGFVRKKFLEPKGVLMERCEGTNYHETWVAMNFHISLATPETHPDFPLWKLGYTPQQVYDVFFPRNMFALCNPDRPAVCGLFGMPEDRLWRFEFLVLDAKGEDGTRMAEVEARTNIVFPYITHPGERYGLSESVQYPTDCLETLRARPYTFDARSCNKWALGRTILAGDAAHVFPPFAGQGIVSGLRDASGLAWRLAMLFQQEGNTTTYESILESWYRERKQQFDRSLATTIRNGDYMRESNHVKSHLREWYHLAVQQVPSWKREIEKGQRAGGMVRYRHEDSFPFADKLGGGGLCPQVYTFDFRNNQVGFSDDIIFAPEKKGLFQALILADAPEEIEGSIKLLKGVENLSYGMLRPGEATVLIQDLDCQPENLKDGQALADDRHYSVAARLASAEEFAASPLCKGRPVPRLYDPHRLRHDVKDKPLIILRPDRFVFAACSTHAEVEEALLVLRNSLFN